MFNLPLTILTLSHLLFISCFCSISHSPFLLYLSSSFLYHASVQSLIHHSHCISPISSFHLSLLYPLLQFITFHSLHLTDMKFCLRKVNSSDSRYYQHEIHTSATLSILSKKDKIKGKSSNSLTLLYLQPPIQCYHLGEQQTLWLFAIHQLPLAEIVSGR